ncbi:hypothetical protein PG985_007212 [Apiospora marii]|uniref:Uncharacterized protein n=1 Tax=Apiospora marii TaxID=335849 RepID=A0ABR1SEP3_9PEZI
MIRNVAADIKAPARRAPIFSTPHHRSRVRRSVGSSSKVRFFRLRHRRRCSHALWWAARLPGFLFLLRLLLPVGLRLPVIVRLLDPTQRQARLPALRGILLQLPQRLEGLLLLRLERGRHVVDDGGDELGEAHLRGVLGLQLGGDRHGGLLVVVVGHCSMSVAVLSLLLLLLLLLFGQPAMCIGNQSGGGSGGFPGLLGLLGLLGSLGHETLRQQRAGLLLYRAEVLLFLVASTDSDIELLFAPRAADGFGLDTLSSGGVITRSAGIGGAAVAVRADDECRPA